MTLRDKRKRILADMMALALLKRQPAKELTGDCYVGCDTCENKGVCLQECNHCEWRFDCPHGRLRR